MTAEEAVATIRQCGKDGVCTVIVHETDKRMAPQGKFPHAITALGTRADTAPDGGVYICVGLTRARLLDLRDQIDALIMESAQ